MTEAEKTEMAILKAKADQKTKSQIEQSKAQEKKAQEKIQADELLNKPKELKESKIEPKIETKETKEPKVDKNKFPYEVKLGENKTVNYKPWTGKTKKKFKKIFEHLQDPEDLDFKQVVQVLVRDNLLTPDVYLSDNEQQYMTALIRNVSIDDKLEFESSCEHCFQNQDIKTTIEEATHYRPNQFPKEKDQTKFKDIESNSFLNTVVSEIMSGENYDGLTSEADVEMALHIELEDAKSPLEVLEKIDNMTLKDINQMLENFEEFSSSLTFEVEKACKDCGKGSKFSTNEIPGLFESLLS